jgi:hypothetical protein
MTDGQLERTITQLRELKEFAPTLRAGRQLTQLADRLAKLGTRYSRNRYPALIEGERVPQPMLIKRAKAELARRLAKRLMYPAAVALRAMIERGKQAAPAIREATMIGLQLAHELGAQRAHNRTLERELAHVREALGRRTAELALARDELARGSALREAMLEFALIKRYDPNVRLGYKSTSLTINVPRTLLTRIDAALGFGADEMEDPAETGAIAGEPTG